MARKLATHVHVQDEHGQAHVFGPEDKLPAWAAKAITNPKAWVGGEPAPADGSATGDTPAVPPGPDTPQTPVPPAGGDSGKSGPAVPPRAGAGSSLAAWQEYATALGFDPSGAKNRDELIGQLESAGHPVTQSGE